MGRCFWLCRVAQTPAARYTMVMKKKVVAVKVKKNTWRSTGTLVATVSILVCEIAYMAHVVFPAQMNSITAAVLPAAIVQLTNSDRSAQGLSTLTNDPLLAQAAQKKADNMAARGYFSHKSPDGKTPWYWLDLVGYKYSYAGENLAMGFEESKDVQTAWMNSPTHKANIVKPQYARMGVGVAHGMFKGIQTTFVVTFFAAQPEN